MGGVHLTHTFFEHSSWPNCQTKVAEIFSLTSFRPKYFCPYFFWFQNRFDQNNVSTQKSLDLKFFRTTFFYASIFLTTLFWIKLFMGQKKLDTKLFLHRIFMGLNLFSPKFFCPNVVLIKFYEHKNCLCKKMSDQKSFQSTFLLNQHIFWCIKQ